MRIWVFLSLLVLLPRALHAAQPYPAVKVGPLPGYLAGYVYGDDFMQMFNGDRGGEWEEGRYWQPSAQDAVETEAAVRAYIRALARKPTAAATPWGPAAYLAKAGKEVNRQYAEYEVQFCGVFIHGQKRIFCNFFPNTKLHPAVFASDEPSRRIIYVNDGGSWFWQIEYVPSTGTCLGLQINGRG